MKHEPRKPRCICDLCSLGIHSSQQCYVGGVSECHKIKDGMLQYTKFQIDLQQVEFLGLTNGIHW